MLPAVLLLVAMALALSLLYGNLQRDLARADSLEADMHHSLEVRDALADLLEVHLDIQMGIGGHVFTGNPEFLWRYERTVQQVRPALDRLRQLSANGQPPASDMPVLLSAMHDRVGNSRELAALMKAGKQVDAQEMIASSRTTAPMARLRRLLEAMDADALGRFQRSQALSSEIRVRMDRTLDAMLACLGVLLTVGAFACFLIVRSKADQIEYTEALINSVIDPIFVLDETGAILLTNRAAEQKFGYTEGQLSGANAGVLMAEWPDQAATMEWVQKFADSGSKGFVRNWLYRRSNGTCFEANASVSFSRLPEGLRLILVLRAAQRPDAKAGSSEPDLARQGKKDMAKSRAEGTV